MQQSLIGATDESMQDLTAIFSFMSIAKFTELVQELYEDRDSCTAGRAMFVNGVLYYLFQGCKSLEADKNSEFARKCKEYSVLTRNNLEVFICGLELLMPATLENVGALLMGVRNQFLRSDLVLFAHSSSGSLCSRRLETFLVLDTNLNGCCFVSNSWLPQSVDHDQR